MFLLLLLLLLLNLCQPVAYVKEKPLPLEKPLFLNLMYIWLKDE